ncbi:hypothetical protein BKA69DRAFT_143215 [Paraphysoderma sedebokerense]|nr:hypothetical protein BKA69DRAFT_143215 [Paraphysoderma sedebokerense]
MEPADDRFQDSEAEESESFIEYEVQPLAVPVLKKETDAKPLSQAVESIVSTKASVFDFFLSKPERKAIVDRIPHFKILGEQQVPQLDAKWMACLPKYRRNKVDLNDKYDIELSSVLLHMIRLSAAVDRELECAHAALRVGDLDETSAAMNRLREYVVMDLQLKMNEAGGVTSRRRKEVLRKAGVSWTIPVVLPDAKCVVNADHRGRTHLFDAETYSQIWDKEKARAEGARFGMKFTVDSKSFPVRASYNPHLSTTK